MRPILLLAFAVGCAEPEAKPSDSDTRPGFDTHSDTDTAAANTAPTAPVVAITPPAPADAQDLTVTVLTPSEDAEGDPVSYRYAWSVDGAARDDLASETVPAAETADGQGWTVTVTPNDGALDGPSAVASVVIGNQPPSAPVVRIDPASPTPDDDLLLVVETPSVDPNGDTLVQSVRWFVDGAESVSFADATEIPASYVDSNEVWRAVVSVTDGVNAPVSAEASVTVGNTAPELTSVSISPSSAKDNDDLTANVRADDPDGDSLTYRYVWYRDGVEATDVGDSDTVLADATSIGEEWTVTVTASDGLSEATDSAASITIADWDSYLYRHTFTAYVPNDGGTYPTASGSWSTAIYTTGSVGSDDCDLFWNLDAAADRGVCPSCDFAFSGTMSYDAALSSSAGGGRCDAYSDDGIFEWSWRDGFDQLSAYGVPGGRGAYRYGAFSLYLAGTGGYSYSGSSLEFVSYWAVTGTEDTAGNVTIEGYFYNTARY